MALDPVLGSGPAADTRSEEAARHLEAYFLRHMMAEMRKSAGSGFLDGGYSGKVFQEMMDEALADAMADSGGIGIADVVASQLESQSRASANTKAFHAPSFARLAYSNVALSELPVPGSISSGFGARTHPISGERRFHSGVDIAATRGSLVRAAGDATVVRAGPAGDYGNLVVLDHGGGIESRYAHLDEISVEIGARIEKGQALGAVGSTGSSTGPHLHFEVRRGGRAVDPSNEVLGNLLKLPAEGTK